MTHSAKTQVLRYRPEIDGLRALAVVAVVLYHAGVGVPGGFVGVDVFFVISGFLISNLILRDLDQGQFSLTRFWERRARRIVPAYAVVVLTTLFFGWVISLPSDFANLAEAAAWQAAFAGNFHSWLHTDYFGTAAEEQALLHMWSLAVEEQFYLLFPLLLILLYRFPRFHSRKFLLRLFCAGFFMSLALSIYMVPRMPVAAFYLLPTRAWELLLGAIVSLAPLCSLPGSYRNGLKWAALSLIAIPCAFYTKETSFPGLAALPPCLGSALLIWASCPAAEERPGKRSIIDRFLTCRPVVFIGLISYSLYLWHWPLCVFLSYGKFPDSTMPGGFIVVAVSFLLACLSWRFVETPFRVKKIGATSKRMLAYAASAQIGLLILGLILCSFEGVQKVRPDGVEGLQASIDPQYQHEMTVTQVRAGSLPVVGSVDSVNRPDFLIWGDSHAMAALPAIHDLLLKNGVAGRVATRSSTAPLIGPRTSGLGDEALAFNDAVLNYLEDSKIKNVLLIARWTSYQDVSMDGARDGDLGMREAWNTTVRKIVVAGATPWVMLQVPEHSFSASKCLTRAALFDLDPSSLFTAACTSVGFIGNERKLMNELEKAGVRFIFTRDAFLDPGGTNYLAVKDGVPLFCDHDHLTSSGARLILGPVLEKAFGSFSPKDRPLGENPILEGSK